MFTIDQVYTFFDFSCNFSFLITLDRFFVQPFHFTFHYSLLNDGQLTEYIIISSPLSWGGTFRTHIKI